MGAAGTGPASGPRESVDEREVAGTSDPGPVAAETDPTETDPTETDPTETDPTETGATERGELAERTERADGSVAPAGPWWRRSPSMHHWVGAGSFLAVLVIVLARNWWIVSEPRVEDGDFAVNSVLIDSARHGRLLIGNYSRVGFNHPGPALLYVQAIGQVLAFDLVRLVPRPFNAHVLGIVVFYAALIAAGASIVARRCESWLAGAVVPVAALALAVAQPGAIASTWFPDIYIWPFFLLTIAAASVLSGEARDLPFVLLALGFLCHGHVSFLLFAGGFVVLLAIVLVRRRQRSELTLPGRTVVGSVAVVALFALPFVVNLIAHWPGELDDYWRYSRSSEAGGHGIGEVVEFIGGYWSADALGTVLVVGLVLGALAAARHTATPSARRFLLGLAASIAVGTLLTFVYAVRGVDDLAYRYVAEFHLTAPVLTTAIVVIAVVVRTRRPAWAAAGLAVAALVLAGRSEIEAVYPGAPAVIPAERFLDASLPLGQPRVFRFSLDTWPVVAGIVEEGRRNGDEVCIEEPQYGFLFSNPLVCDEAQRATGVVVAAYAPATAPADLDVDVTYVSDAVVLTIVGS